MPDELLDLGFWLPLRKLALQSGSELNALRYLMSEEVQTAIVSSFEASAASSLPVERAFAETKRSEAPRLCHVATAGRNQQIRQHLRQRQDLLEAAEKSVAQLRRSMTESLLRLAWEVYSKLAPADLHGNSAATQAFVRQHGGKLKAELERRREAARIIVEGNFTGDLPVTQQQWIAWFREHDDEFRDKMSVAGARRKAANSRLTPAPDIPLLVACLAANRPKVKVHKLAPWQQMCWGRAGWFCLQTD